MNRDRHIVRCSNCGRVFDDRGDDYCPECGVGYWAWEDVDGADPRDQAPEEFYDEVDEDLEVDG